MTAMASSGSQTAVLELESYQNNGSAAENPNATLPISPSHSQSPPEGSNVSQLEPADRGSAAWRLLCAAFVFEALLWGFPLSFGVFQDYYSQLPEFANDPHISVVGTIASGICYMGAPVAIPIVRQYAKYQRHMLWLGWPICILALVAGSFAKTLSTLIFTQGIMYGLGFVICYYPILSMVNEFWIARRGMAYGFLCSSSGASSSVMPLVLQALLRKYGYPTTLRAVAVMLVITTGPMIPLLKGRLPVAESGGSLGKTDWSFLKKPLFWIYSASNLLMGLGYFFPSLYLPSYATSIGISSLQGALLLSAMSVAQVLGQFTFGYLSDKNLPLNGLIVVTLVVSSAATFALWGIARSLAPLLVFAMFFGFFGAGYTPLWARMVSAISEGQSNSLVVYSLFSFGKGVGNVLAGPISAALILPAVRIGSYGVMKYKAVVIYTGGCMLLSAIVISILYMKPKR